MMKNTIAPMTLGANRATVLTASSANCCRVVATPLIDSTGAISGVAVGADEGADAGAAWKCMWANPVAVGQDNEHQKKQPIRSGTVPRLAV
jgi:hypothetical protein